MRASYLFVALFYISRVRKPPCPFGCHRHFYFGFFLCLCHCCVYSNWLTECNALCLTFKHIYFVRSFIFFHRLQSIGLQKDVRYPLYRADTERPANNEARFLNSFSNTVYLTDKTPETNYDIISVECKKTTQGNVILFTKSSFVNEMNMTVRRFCRDSKHTHFTDYYLYNLMRMIRPTASKE